MASKIIQEGVAQARKDQKQLYEDALESAKSELHAVAEATTKEAVVQAREDQKQLYEAALESAKSELHAMAEATTKEAVAQGREDQKQLYEAALESAKSELHAMAEATTKEAVAQAREDPEATIRGGVGVLGSSNRKQDCWDNYRDRYNRTCCHTDNHHPHCVTALDP